KVPSRPVEPADRLLATADEPAGREEGHDLVQQPLAMPDEQVRQAVATLFRVIRPEPRLRIGEAEAMEL
ncbi:hypothetical protein, partial [Saccharothrix sp. ST-888]|uniref:hypothetical protein n=1 Tax=Saccharothrix sp. ST-888 TaxID=1427391 RepID=UPI000AD6E65F